MNWIEARNPVERKDCPGFWKLANRRGTGSFQAKSLAEASGSGEWWGPRWGREGSDRQDGGLIHYLQEAAPTPDIRQFRE